MKERTAARVLESPTNSKSTTRVIGLPKEKETEGGSDG